MSRSLSRRRYAIGRIVIIGIVLLVILGAGIGLATSLNPQKSSSSSITQPGNSSSTATIGSSSFQTTQSLTSTNTNSEISSGHTAGPALFQFQALISSSDSKYGYFAWQNISFVGRQVLQVPASGTTMPEGRDVYVTASDRTIQHALYSTVGKAYSTSSSSLYSSFVVQNVSLPSRISLLTGAEVGDVMVLSIYNDTGPPFIVLTGIGLYPSPLGPNGYNLTVTNQCAMFPCFLPSGVTIELQGAVSVWDAIPASRAIQPLSLCAQFNYNPCYNDWVPSHDIISTSLTVNFTSHHNSLRPMRQ